MGDMLAVRRAKAPLSHKHFFEDSRSSRSNRMVTGGLVTMVILLGTGCGLWATGMLRIDGSAIPGSEVTASGSTMAAVVRTEPGSAASRDQAAGEALAAVEEGASELAPSVAGATEAPVVRNDAEEVASADPVAPVETGSSDDVAAAVEAPASTAAEAERQAAVSVRAVSVEEVPASASQPIQPVQPAASVAPASAEPAEDRQIASSGADAAAEVTAADDWQASPDDPELSSEGRDEAVKRVRADMERLRAMAEAMRTSNEAGAQ